MQLLRILSVWRLESLSQLALPIVSTNAILLTVTGFVVGLGLSFRSSTAYERFVWLDLR